METVREALLVTASRACGILYNLLKSLPNTGPFLLPANVCPIVPLTFLKAGRPFELVDISPADYGMDQQIALQQLSHGQRRYAGILYVRTYGAMLPVDDFFERVKAIDGDLVVIDDRCLAIPRFEDEDSSADVVLYSTGASKYVDLGHGGYGFVRATVPYREHPTRYCPEDLAQLTRQYKQAVAGRQSFRYTDSDWLDNSPLPVALDDYRRQVEDAAREVSDWKRSINEIYRAGVPPEAQLSGQYQQWRFNIRIAERDCLLKSVFAQGLFASAHYASLGGIFSPQRDFHAERLGADIVNLFNDRHFSPEKAERLVKVIAAHWAAADTRNPESTSEHPSPAR